ncbi:Fur family transcriptional regulator [Paracoccus sp. (in: a-proteobacteria)]|uniref:Fur family transcriptional regulator n=1 Tax=Paracoccus sp. TaxID=267 RepID=UPI0026E0FF73|nr:Fur family transcriptional regulator [Paracoccus sp. (in: a-proteobacteria)]MDO5648002.1 Fur family transcriptional regulator [Paracoccus sp. (in: a-proteobacteria)]
MTDFDDTDDLLNQAGLRMTAQRQAIMRVLLTSNDHPDAEEVLRRARDFDASISQATTYRTLATLTERGVLRSHTFDSGVTRFELANRPHHDHIIDIDSGEIVEFVSHEIERLQQKIAAAHGYDIIAHRLELYCRKRPAGD